MDYPYDAAVAEAFLARVWRGARIRDLLGRPGMPSQRAYAHWRRTEAAFAGRLSALRRLRYGRRSREGRGRWKAFDEALADRMLLRVMKGEPWRRMLETEPDMPSRAVVYRWRGEHPDWDGALKMAFKAGRLAREKVRREPLPGLVDEVCFRILEGGSLRSVGGHKDMPWPNTLYAWFRRYPGFAAEVLRACDLREDWYNDQMIDAFQRHGPFDGPAAMAEVRPLQRQLNRLAKRPGRTGRRPLQSAHPRESDPS